MRRALDDAGAGFDAELEMLADARAAGFRILACVKSGAEAAGRLAPEMICINSGWNAGGRLTDLVPDVSINQAILRTRQSDRRPTRAGPATHVLIEGGPVVHPRQVAEIRAEAATPPARIARSRRSARSMSSSGSARNCAAITPGGCGVAASRARSRPL